MSRPEGAAAVALLLLAGLPLLAAAAAGAWDARAARAREASELAEARAWRRLATTTVSLDFSRASLAEFAEFLEAETGVPFRVDAGAVADLGPDGARVTLRVTNLSAAQALNLVCRLKRLEPTWRDGAIVIGPIEPTVLQIFLVVDLVQPLAHSCVSIPSAEPSAPRPPFPGALSEDDLIGSIEVTCAPQTWEQPGRSLDLRNGSLVVRQTPAVQEEIRGFLEELRAARG